MGGDVSGFRGIGSIDFTLHITLCGKGKMIEVAAGGGKLSYTSASYALKGGARKLVLKAEQIVERICQL